MPSSTTRKTTKRATAPEHAARDAAAKYQPTTWGQVGGSEDLTCPSGQVALVTRPGLQGLIKRGVLNNVDVLTKLVGEAKTGGVSTSQVSELLGNPEKFDEMVHIIDRVVCEVVLQPALKMTPNDVTSRVHGEIYADMVELEDKMFIFQYALGGSRDIERFRSQSTADVGSVDDVEDVEGSPE